jgi:NhaP-type Na+/H+ or K+/H+ antiporter
MPRYLKETNPTSEGFNEGGHGEGISETTQIGLMIVTVCMMIIYIIVGSVCESRKCKFGHETGLILILGLGVSACIFYFSHKTVHWELSAEILFQLCIPLVLFAEGYTMHRSLFAKEISNSMVLGILVVIVTFILHFLLTSLWMH